MSPLERPGRETERDCQGRAWEPIRNVWGISKTYCFRICHCNEMAGGLCAGDMVQEEGDQTVSCWLCSGQLCDLGQITGLRFLPSEVGLMPFPGKECSAQVPWAGRRCPRSHPAMVLWCGGWSHLCVAFCTPTGLQSQGIPPSNPQDPGWHWDSCIVPQRGQDRLEERSRVPCYKLPPMLVLPPHPSSPEYLVTVNLILSATARILSRFWEPKVQGFRNGMPGGSPSMITEPGLLLMRL